jgi:predicted DNA-binding transcriptional regulator YafY
MIGAVGDQSSRMLALLSLLQVRREWAGDELAGRLDVSPRTVRRDVDRLRAMGYRVDASRGPAGGYRLVAGSDLPPLLFDDDQAVALALALAVAPASGADIAEAAARALATVRQLLPARLRHRVDAVHVARPAAPAAGGVDAAVLVTVSEAVHRREELRFDYTPPLSGPPHDSDSPKDGPRPPRRVEPLAVVARQSRWYLLAWDLERDDWRTFRIDRMTPRQRTGKRCAPRAIPGDDPAAFVAGLFKGTTRADAWPCHGSVIVTPDVAHAAAVYLPDDAVVEPLDPERCRITRGSWSWHGLAATFAQLPGSFTIDGPPQLRAAARELSDRLQTATSTAPAEHHPAEPHPS